MRLCERLDVGERAVAEQRALADIVCCVESRTRKLLLSCSRDRSSGRAPGAAASFEPATPSPGHLVPRGVCRPVHHHPSSDSSMPRRRESAAAAAAAAAGTQPTQQQRARPFSAVHRLAFVQELMRKGVVLEAHALDTFEQLTGSSSVDALHDMIAEQNAAMAGLSLQVRTLRCPLDSQVYVGFVNTMADEPSKLATHYSHAQREYFKHVLEAIAADASAQGGAGSASSMQLLNMDLGPRGPAAAAAAAAAAGEDADGAAAANATAAALRKMTKGEKEAALRQLVDDHWLRHSETHSGHYCIGVRSFLELSDLLLSFELPEATREAWMDVL